MKKNYQEMQLVVTFFTEEIVRTSQNDNVQEMPEFPEEFLN